MRRAAIDQLVRCRARIQCEPDAADADWERKPRIGNNGGMRAKKPVPQKQDQSNALSGDGASTVDVATLPSVKKSESTKATEEARRGDPLPVNSRDDRSPKQENL